MESMERFQDGVREPHVCPLDAASSQSVTKRRNPSASSRNAKGLMSGGSLSLADGSQLVEDEYPGDAFNDRAVL
jgi:hypothetical protein